MIDTSTRSGAVLATALDTMLAVDPTAGVDAPPPPPRLGLVGGTVTQALADANDLADAATARLQLEEHVDALLAEVRLELLGTRSSPGALDRFPAMLSPHDGWAVVYEEVDELLDEVKADKRAGARTMTPSMAKEATQVAAMGVRFALDVADALGATAHVRAIRLASTAVRFLLDLSGSNR